MTVKRLKSPTGIVADNTQKESDANDKIVRSAVLVHSGPEGKALVFASADGDTKPFDDKRIKQIVEKHNKKIQLLAAEYGGMDKMPMGAFPPILDQHEDDSSTRIGGRLADLLRFEKRDLPKVGKNVSCVVSELTFLGDDTVKRTKDGRIYHLSIGIDESTDSIAEVSTVIEPAAPGAALLQKGNQKKEKVNMAKKSATHRRLKAKIERVTKLNAMAETLGGLQKSLKSTGESIQTTRRLTAVSSRLTKLMAAKKLTPAEFKGMDMKHLSTLDDKSLDIVMKTFEARQDVINPGQKGTSAAVDASTITKNLQESQLKRLRLETRNELKRLGAKLKNEDKEEKEMSGPKEKEVHPGKDPAASGQSSDQDDGKPDHLKNMSAALEAGDIEEARKHYAAYEGKDEADKEMDAGKIESPEIPVPNEPADQQQAMESMQKQIDELSTQLARCVGVMTEMMKAEKDEEQELEAGDDEPKEDDEE